MKAGIAEFQTTLKRSR